MLAKGMKIKVIAPLGNFNNVGEICDIVDVVNDEIIVYTFGHNGVRVGVISVDKFNKYFEVYDESKKTEETLTISDEYIDAIIDNSDVEFETVYGTTMVMRCTLPNGYVLTESVTSSGTEYYDEDAAFEVCMSRIIEKVWEFEEYRLHCMVYEMEDEEIPKECLECEEFESCYE